MLADFDNFRLKAALPPPPAGRVVGRRLIFPTDYVKTKAHEKNQLIWTLKCARNGCLKFFWWLVDGLIEIYNQLITPNIAIRPPDGREKRVG